MDLREENLQKWLVKSCKLPVFEMYALPGDASFRRYFRIKVPDGSYVAMDAPPPGENCLPYVAITTALRAMGLKTPEVYGSDLQQGYLLLSDFGDELYLSELNHGNADDLYGRALDALAILQTCRQVNGWTIPLFTAEFMRNELELFKEWFLHRYLNLSLTAEIESKLNECFDFLAQSAANQKQVFMHRDYHSANLMILPDLQVGILDFQDAFIGPVTYDLVSLLRDCYIAWPDTFVTKLVLQYREKIKLFDVSEEEFLRWFDLMGLQRHMKALLTFSRKFCRDKNPNYLQHIPRTLQYIKKASARHVECTALHQFIRDQVLACVE